MEELYVLSVTLYDLRFDLRKGSLFLTCLLLCCVVGLWSLLRRRLGVVLELAVGRRLRGSLALLPLLDIGARGLLWPGLEDGREPGDSTRTLLEVRVGLLGGGRGTILLVSVGLTGPLPHIISCSRVPLIPDI